MADSSTKHRVTPFAFVLHTDERYTFGSEYSYFKEIASNCDRNMLEFLLLALLEFTDCSGRTEI